MKKSLQSIRILWLALLLAFVCPWARAVPWFPFGPEGGDARAFAADPKDHSHLYLGTLTGWIYESHDDGRSWARLAQVGRRDDLALDNIVVDPLDNRHLVVGAWVIAALNHPDGGLFTSHDAGRTWTSDPAMQGESVRALAIAPSQPRRMVAGTLSGVFQSDDSGGTWQRISPKGDREIHEIESIAIDPVDPATIYAGTWHLPWKTTDGGAHWTNIKRGIIEDSDVFSIIVDPKDPNVVYASACSGIYKSVDAGEQFTGGVGANKAQGIPSSARRTRVLMQDPNHLSTVFAGTTQGLYRTDDGGKYWVQTTGSEIIVNDVYVDPTDSRRVLLATDRGGVIASDDGGSSFVPSNTGFSTRQISAYTSDAQHPATLYVGVVNDKEQGGVFISRTGGLSWTQESAGLEGSDVFALGQAPDGTILAGTGHGIYRLKDAIWQRANQASSTVPRSGASSVRRQGAGTPHPPARPALSFDGSVNGFATAGQTLFAATSRGVLRSVSSGLAWSPVITVPQDEWRFLAAARNNVVVASLTAIQLSIDGGASWNAVALPPQVSQVLALCVDGHGNVWVSGRDGVYYSPNRGSSWQTLGDLYVRNVNSIFYDGSADRVLVTSPGKIAFAVQLATMQVSTWDTGWNLRFVRPVGDHLVAGTLYDGIVVQPRMVDSPPPTAVLQSGPSGSQQAAKRWSPPR